MSYSLSGGVAGIGELTEEQKTRAGRANEILRQACKEHGVETCCLHRMDGWRQYVAGSMSETELYETAKKELQEGGIVQSVQLAAEEQDLSELQEIEKERARRANEIYRKVCQEMDLSFCFFSGFLSWSAFVEGEMSEQEFYEKAREEARQLAQQS